MSRAMGLDPPVPVTPRHDFRNGPEVVLGVLTPEALGVPSQDAAEVLRVRGSGLTDLNEVVVVGNRLVAAVANNVLHENSLFRWIGCSPPSSGFWG